MKKYFIFLGLCAYFSTISFGQLNWAKNFGSTNLDEGTDVTIDNFGNIYTTGFFQGTIDFDPNTTTLNLSSAGERDFFIAKYDNLGQLIWAKGIGGGNFEHGRSILLDGDGNIFVAGDFNGLVDFDPGIGFNFRDVKGDFDIFLAKYDPQGNFIWAKGFGGIGTETCHDLAMDASGNLYLTGIFQGTADFDPNGGVSNLTSAGSFDSFIVKVDGSGNYLWAKSIESTNTNSINEIVVDFSGNINMVGYFQGTADFDPSAAVFSMTTIGNKSAFFGKFNSQGQFIDAKMIGGSGFEVGKSIAVDMLNNIYLTGDFRGVVDFDPSSNTNFLTSAGLRDIFVAKYTAQGSLVWADKIGGQGEEQASVIKVDNQNSIYVGGNYNDNMTLSNSKTFTSKGNTDIIITRYNTNGLLQFAVSQGGINGDEIAHLVSNNNGEVFNIGWIQGVSIFGTTSLTSTGDRDIYIARTVMSPISATKTSFINPDHIVVFPNPSNGQFQVTLDGLDAESLDVTMLDATGRILKQEKWQTLGQSFYQHQFEQSDLTPGLYFLRITANAQVMTKKLIIN